jgi:hypothetical protein
VSLFNGLRTWWQLKTGEDETPLDGYAPVWVVSMAVHLVLMLVLSFMYVGSPPKPVATIVQAAPLEEDEPEPFELVEDFTFAEIPAEDIGANSFDVDDAAKSVAMIVSDLSQVPSPETLITETNSEITIDNTIQIATGLHYSENLPVAGAAGEGVTGATGAVDRITHEILLSLEERKTLVVWLFDKSPSMIRQRSEVIERFDRIYRELGVIEAAGNEAFAKHDDKPLLTSVVAFGHEVNLLTKEPTDNVAEIKEVVAGIENDMTGEENVFSAVFQSANRIQEFPHSELNHASARPQCDVGGVHRRARRRPDRHGQDRANLPSLYHSGLCGRCAGAVWPGRDDGQVGGSRSGVRPDTAVGQRESGARIAVSRADQAQLHRRT